MKGKDLRHGEAAAWELENLQLSTTYEGFSTGRRREETGPGVAVEARQDIARDGFLVLGMADGDACARRGGMFCLLGAG